LNGSYEPGKTAIVSDAAQFGSNYGTSASIPQLQGNFLLVSETVGFIYRKNLENKVVWSQNVQVQAGKKYQFKVSIAELSSLLLGQYNFSEVILLVDDKALTLTWNSDQICAQYIASQNKTVKLTILKVEGFRVFNGSLGIDNITFAPIVQSAASAREDNSSEEAFVAFSVSPNPATDHLRIAYKSPNVSPSYVEILESYTGRVIKTIPMTGAELHIPLDGLASGMYLAKLYAGDGSLVGIQKFLTVK